MTWIGIDPGAKGGYCSISDGKVKVFLWDDVLFIQHMRDLAASGDRLMACVEKVGAMPGQGRSSIFTFGREYGFILGVLQALNIPYQTVPPAVWKRTFSLIGKDKKASIATCQRLFPDVSLLATPRSRVPSDGLAESVLICCHGMRRFKEAQSQ